MLRVVYKKQWLADAEKEYEALDQFLAARQTACRWALGEWSARDMLARPYEWRNKFFEWHAPGWHRESPTTPAAECKWVSFRR